MQVKTYVDRSALSAAQHVLALENVAGKILSLADAMDITRGAQEA